MREEGAGGGGRRGIRQPKSANSPDTHAHTQETGSLIQYRPNHSSLPKSRLDGEPTLWGRNTKKKRRRAESKRGRGGLEGAERSGTHIIASRGVQ